MRYYPLLLDLAQARCLLVGAGRVGRRKLATLLECPVGEVLVLETGPAVDTIAPELRELLDNPAVTFEHRAFTPADVQGCSLVFAASSDRAVNEAVARACHVAGIACNVADAPEQGTMIVPAHICHGDLMITVSSAGKSPALTKVLKEDLEHWLQKRYHTSMTLLGRLRPLVLALGLGSDENATIFRALASLPVRDLLETAFQDKNQVQCERLLRQNLPQALHSHIPELLHDLV